MNTMGKYCMLVAAMLTLFSCLYARELGLPQKQQLTPQEEEAVDEMSQSFLIPDDKQETSELASHLFMFGGYCIRERDRVISELRNERVMLKAMLTGMMVSAGAELMNLATVSAGFATVQLHNRIYADKNSQQSEKQVQQVQQPQQVSQEQRQLVDKIVDDNLAKMDSTDATISQHLAVATKTVTGVVAHTMAQSVYQSMVSLSTYVAPSTVMTTLESACDRLAGNYVTKGEQELQEFKQQLLDSLQNSNSEQHKQMMDDIRGAKYATIGCRTSDRVLMMNKVCRMIRGASAIVMQSIGYL